MRRFQWTCSADLQTKPVTSARSPGPFTLIQMCGERTEVKGLWKESITELRGDGLLIG